MKRFMLFCAAFAAVVSAYADAVYFRSGAILCAEQSTVKPEGFIRLGSAVKPESPVYVAVTVKLDKERKISIFDYTLRVGGGKYECTVLRDNTSGRFVELSEGGKKHRCTLFFELPSPPPRGEKAVLVCNAPGGGAAEIKIVNRGSRRFTPDAKIADPGK